MPDFDIIIGPGAGRSFRVEQEEFTIGRGSAHAVPLEDEAAGSPHARVVRGPNGFVLTDLDTPAGTLMNGYRVKEIPLYSGDEIRIGRSVIRFSDGSAPVGESSPLLEPAGEGVPLVTAQLVGEPGPLTVEPVMPVAEPAPLLEPAAPLLEPLLVEGPPRAATGAPLREAIPPTGETQRIRVTKAPTRVAIPKRLLKTVVCANCWHSFPPEDILFVAQHPDLIGDKIAGLNEYRRFLPTRFTLDGRALDERNVPTTLVACPHCHLSLPEAASEVTPIFISIVGSPASGKSYFLTAMTGKLRQLAPERLRLQFTDADVVMNAVIQDGENILFRSPSPDKLAELPKTQRDDPRLHRTVTVDKMDIRYPVPFQFLLRPAADHPCHAETNRISRMIVLYDNAGEDSLPQAIDPTSAAVQHLAKSEIILLLFDPIQEPAFREHCKSKDPQLTHGLRPAGTTPVAQVRQEQIVNEVGARIRRFHRLPAGKRLNKPLVVIVPKFDIWADLAGESIEDEPFLDPGDGSPWRVDLARIERISNTLRGLFLELCPAFVATAENVSQCVRYIPVSSLGRSPVLSKRGTDIFYGFRPRDIRPKWVTVPFLYCLCKWGPKGLLHGTPAPGNGTPAPRNGNGNRQ
jgi:pSer/pThr/pTyr-binding forkhead associated (FHA) protein